MLSRRKTIDCVRGVAAIVAASVVMVGATSVASADQNINTFQMTKNEIQNRISKLKDWESEGAERIDELGTMRSELRGAVESARESVAEATDLLKETRKAFGTLDRTRRETEAAMWKQWQQRPDIVELAEKVEAAERAVQARREEVLAPVRASERYAALMAEVTAAESKRDKARTDGARLTAMNDYAKQIMAAQQAVREYEQQALADDSELKQLQEKLKRLVSEARAARDSFEAEIRNSESLRSLAEQEREGRLAEADARRSLNEARRELNLATAKLERLYAYARDIQGKINDLEDEREELEQALRDEEYQDSRRVRDNRDRRD